MAQQRVRLGQGVSWRKYSFVMGQLEVPNEFIKVASHTAEQLASTPSDLGAGAEVSSPRAEGGHAEMATVVGLHPSALPSAALGDIAWGGGARSVPINHLSALASLSSQALFCC